ncbi:Nucleotidyltransferase [Pluteus cervinus]|uniref:Nucleotidyltransferase n=1 Tax=Pluteus cervinus TaxID=181527 RepID=A0ACD3BA52_9AGAR|nr:Nucleotidyltransferase [Pluteus cervinus]
MHKREPPSGEESSRSNSPSLYPERPAKRTRLSFSNGWPESNDETIKVHIIQAKLDASTISELFFLIERQRAEQLAASSSLKRMFELRNDPLEADVIVTAVRMRKRLERHVSWDLAQQKALVLPQWLRNSVKQGYPAPCADYAALRELHGETEENCPDEECGTSLPCASTPQSRATSAIVGPLQAPVPPNLKYTAHYSCARACPLVCINQDLIEELEVIRRSRELEGLDRNALSYERGIAAIKSYPKRVTPETFHEVTTLPYLGEKLCFKVNEFIKTGTIPEAREIATSERYRALAAITTVYGIGPATARTLYDKGVRTIEHLESYYDVSSDGDASNLDTFDAVTPNGRPIPQQDPPDLPIKVALALRKDFEIKIPRAEVEEMHDVVMRELFAIQPGCKSMIVGGYRRGKLESNDVDIVICPPKAEDIDEVKGLCAKLVKCLHDKALVTNVMHLSGFHTHDPFRLRNFDSLEKALTVFVLPPDGKRKRVHRRLDLIFALPESYWTAIIGWTGSKMFQRDLRLWAKVEKGMKFDSSGLNRRYDSKLFYPKSEKDVFDILGLDWVDPTLRNADA